MRGDEEQHTRAKQDGPKDQRGEHLPLLPRRPGLCSLIRANRCGGRLVEQTCTLPSGDMPLGVVHDCCQ